MSFPTVDQAKHLIKLSCVVQKLPLTIYRSQGLLVLAQLLSWQVVGDALPSMCQPEPTSRWNLHPGMGQDIQELEGLVVLVSE